MKVKVDLDRCQGHGNCEMSAPSIFQLSAEDGLSRVVAPEVGEDQRGEVEDAVNGCPERAIEFVDR